MRLRRAKSLKELTDVELEKKLSRSRVYSNFCKTYKLSVDFIEKHAQQWDMRAWYTISWYQELNDELVSKYADRVNWIAILFCYELNEDFIIKHWGRFYSSEKPLIDLLCKKQKLSSLVIDKFFYALNWNHLLYKSKVDENLLLKYNSYFNWHHAVETQKLSMKFIKNNVGKMFTIGAVCAHQKISEKFIEEHSDLMDNDVHSWHLISQNKKIKLSQKFIEKHKHKLSIRELSRTNELSENFIVEHIDDVCFNGISKKSKLSESFMEKYEKKINWYYVSRYQTLSESFIEKNMPLLSFADIAEQQPLSVKFIVKHLNKFIKNSWHMNCLKSNKKVNHQELDEKGVWVMVAMLR